MSKKRNSHNRSQKKRRTTCKVCNSQVMDDVNLLIKDGLNEHQISEHFRLKNIIIPVGSIRFHKKNHYSFQISKLKKSRKKVKKKSTSTKKKSTIKSTKQKITNKLANNSKVKYKKANDNRKTQEIINDSDDNIADKQLLQKRKKYIKRINKIYKDFDIISEMVFMLKLQKERVFMAKEAEEQAGVPLSVTGKAYDEYQKSLAKVHELTKGMESLKELRFAEVAQMFIGLMSRKPLSDRSRFELFTVLKGFESIKKPDETFVGTKEEINKFEEKYKTEQLKNDVKAGRRKISTATNKTKKKSSKKKKVIKKPPKKKISNKKQVEQVIENQK